MSRMYPPQLRGPLYQGSVTAPTMAATSQSDPAQDLTSSSPAIVGQGMSGVPRRARALPPFYNATAGGHPHRVLAAHRYPGHERMGPHQHGNHPLTRGWSQRGFPTWSQSPRVLIVNPMHMVNLSEHTKSSLVRFIETIKRFSEKWFSHVLLLLFLAIYACIGAYVFIHFEGRNEQYEKQMIIDMRLKIVNDSWEARDRAKVAYFELIKVRFEEYERLMNRACAMGITTSSLETQWTFWGALFYSMTVFTTIGYGQLTPITFAGRVATMIYAIFGIPILLMVLADLGKLLTRVIKFIFNKLRVFFWSLFRRKSAMKTRKIITDNTNQYMGAARDALNKGIGYVPQALRTNSIRKSGTNSEEPTIGAVEGKKSPGRKEPKALSTTTPRNNSEEFEMSPVIVTSSPPTPAVSPSTPGQDGEEPQELTFDDVDDEFDLPVSVALALLILYMMFGAIIFSAWEGWQFFDSLYFVFISMSTIGFGDLVPQHPKRMMATFIYLLFGLALTSMCINVVQEKIHATFLRAKMQIGEKMGLDLEQIMADDYGYGDNQSYDEATSSNQDDDGGHGANGSGKSPTSFERSQSADGSTRGGSQRRPNSPASVTSSNVVQAPNVVGRTKSSGSAKDSSAPSEKSTTVAPQAATMTAAARLPQTQKSKLKPSSSNPPVKDKDSVTQVAPIDERRAKSPSDEKKPMTRSMTTHEAGPPDAPPRPRWGSTKFSVV